ncbi:MAG: PAS domain-containing protein [Candidatus Eisenbacteria bacterium]|nr:PAS domain-containing protein [Candidatus Eisenbacteria bacterium]
MSPVQGGHREREVQPPVDAAGVILDSIAEGVFTVDGEWCITSFNRAAEEITGTPRDEAIGRPCWEVFRTSICESACALKETMRTGERMLNRRVFIVTSEGERKPIAVSTALLRDADGEVVGGVETFRDLSVEETLRKELRGRRGLGDMVGGSRPMREIFELLPDVAESMSTVLILGESGTGKELLARAIHDLSPRSDGPFVVVNCGALPDNLLESELFGHKAGAFTGARGDREGRFARARGGTIFLDEIGDVSPNLQSRLLRVLQDGSFDPVGASRPESSDARVIAATNRDLAGMVESGEFRQDLYYRINVFPMTLPPLRERREDIPYLVDHFIERFRRLKGKEITGIEPGALSLLMRAELPGNVRELENVIEHAFIMARGSTVRARHLPESVRGRSGRPEPASFDDAERDLIVRTLAKTGWNRTAAARELGIHKTTLWRKMKKLDIEPPA